MRRHIVRFVGVVCMMGALGLTAAAPVPPAITLTLNPLVGFRPLLVEARLSIPPNYLNVGWCLQWFQQGAEDPDGRHCEQLDGQYEPRVHVYLIKALDTGQYEVSATLLYARGTERTTFQAIRVFDSPTN